MGPPYIKVGQILATRPDLVSDEARKELSQLNGEVEPRPFEEFEAVPVAQLGADWRSNFFSVDTRRPLGTASPTQVYGAVFRDGTPCVLKVQRPDLALFGPSGESVIGRHKRSAHDHPRRRLCQ
ncbi:AarF/UbiB family protein [Streptomyces sp. CA-251251]|uniref:AarF/UbiB family protein n=1 Tax=Streptomyces sp. CA-251251 TaxID=3240063 RepID=UPI003D89D51D